MIVARRNHAVQRRQSARYNQPKSWTLTGGNMNRLLRTLAPAALGILLAAPSIAADQFINVLTGGTSGVYYPLGVALANDIGKAMPGVKTSVQATKASV